MSQPDYPYFECSICGHTFFEDDMSPIDYASPTCKHCGENEEMDSAWDERVKNQDFTPAQLATIAKIQAQQREENEEGE